MRDKLSSELFKSVGVPTYSSAYARVIINQDIYGLYNIVDTIGGNWLAAIIHGDDDAHTGTTYKTYAGADLRYRGEEINAYKIGSYKVDEVDTNDLEANDNVWYRLAHFTKLFQDWNRTYENDQSNDAVESLEKFFNLESLLRQMAIESLTFAFDNFLANSGNYALYFNPEKKIYQIIPYDFDGSFYGNKGSPRFKDDYLENPYDCINWANIARINEDTYFVSSLFKHENIKNRYNDIMHKIVNELFNVNKISPLIDSISLLIEDDVAWNSNLIDTLDNNITGFINHYTLEDFKGNTNYDCVKYNPNRNRNQSQFGLKDWINKRGDLCKRYIQRIENISNIVIPTLTSTNKSTINKMIIQTSISTNKNTINKIIPKTTSTNKNTITKMVISTTTSTYPNNKISKNEKDIPISKVNGKCGENYGRCRRESECCSKYGWCGTTSDYCGSGCQSEFGQCSNNLKTTTTKKSIQNKKTTTTTKKSIQNKKTTTTTKKSIQNKKTTTTTKKSIQNKKTTTTTKKSIQNKKTTITTKKPNQTKKTTTTTKKPNQTKKTTTTTKKPNQTKKTTTTTKKPNQTKKTTTTKIKNNKKN